MGWAAAQAQARRARGGVKAKLEVEQRVRPLQRRVAARKAAVTALAGLLQPLIEQGRMGTGKARGPLCQAQLLLLPPYRLPHSRPRLDSYLGLQPTLVTVAVPQCLAWLPAPPCPPAWARVKGKGR